MNNRKGNMARVFTHWLWKYNPFSLDKYVIKLIDFSRYYLNRRHLKIQCFFFHIQCISRRFTLRAYHNSDPTHNNIVAWSLITLFSFFLSCLDENNLRQQSVFCTYLRNTWIHDKESDIKLIRDEVFTHFIEEDAVDWTHMSNLYWSPSLRWNVKISITNDRKCFLVSLPLHAIKREVVVKLTIILIVFPDTDGSFFFTSRITEVRFLC